MTKKQQVHLAEIETIKVKLRKNMTKKKRKALTRTMRELARKMWNIDKYQSTYVRPFRGKNQSPVREETPLSASGCELTDHERFPFMGRDWYEDGVLLNENIGDGVYA